MWFRSAIHGVESHSPRDCRRQTSRQASRSQHAVRRISLEPLEDRRMFSLSPAVSYPVEYGPRAIDAGDFNGDGRVDLVMATQVGNVDLLLNQGDGTFGTVQTISLDGQTGMEVLVGDLNADGKLDLLATTSTQRVSGTVTGPYGYEYPVFTSVGHLKVLYGNGDGSFTPGESKDLGDGRFFWGALADLDNDGDLDTALTNWDGTDLSVLLNNGNGTFTAPQGWAVGPTAQSVSVGDLNSDGKLDLITTILNQDVKVLLGNGNGTFQPAQTVQPGGSNVQGQAVGDVNGDGKLDLAVTSFESSYYSGPYGTYGSTYDIKVMILLGHGDGTFAPGSGYSADSVPLNSVALADVDGDNKLDIVAASYSSGNVNVLHGNGNGTFLIGEPFSTGGGNGGPADFVVVDLNGDGAPDIAAANYGYNTVPVLLNTNGAPPPPTATISNVSITEGNVGTRTLAFTVSLSSPAAGPVTIAFATGDGGAVAGSDYQAASGVLTFAPGETSRPINVTVNGDRIAESDETFFLNLSGANGATLLDIQGAGTILDDEQRIYISDVSKKEGQTGATPFVFTVTLSAPYDAPVTVQYATANGSATSGSDYQAASGLLTFATGQTSKLITVQVNGDRVNEANEYFMVNLSNATNAWIAGSQGLGTIENDDSSPRLSVSDVSRSEGKSGSTKFVFTVSLSSASESRVTVDYATANGSATTGDGDYATNSGKLTFSPGQTSKTVTVTVLGDKKIEGDETFFLNLGNAKGAAIDDGQGLATIMNDDAARRSNAWHALSWAAIDDAIEDFLSLRSRRGHR